MHSFRKQCSCCETVGESLKTTTIRFTPDCTFGEEMRGKQYPFPLKLYKHIIRALPSCCKTPFKKTKEGKGGPCLFPLFSL